MNHNHAQSSEDIANHAYGSLSHARLPGFGITLAACEGVVATLKSLS